MTLTEFNHQHKRFAHLHLQSCCAAEFWIKSLVEARPFISREALLTSSEKIWQTAKFEDALQAFDAHPRIGDVSTLKKKFQSTQQTASHEQSGMNHADDALFELMKHLNDQYFKKFGFIFIVCASGKSAEEMQSMLVERLKNKLDDEWRIAAAEQGKITQLRLKQLILEAT